MREMTLTAGRAGDRRVALEARSRLRFASVLKVLVLGAALALFSATAASARLVNVWVAAVPTWWNVAPTGHDAMTGMPVDPADAIFPTVVYRRYSPHWKHPLRTRHIRARMGC